LPSRTERRFGTPENRAYAILFDVIGMLFHESRAIGDGNWIDVVKRRRSVFGKRKKIVLDATVKGSRSCDRSITFADDAPMIFHFPIAAEAAICGHQSLR